MIYYLYGELQKRIKTQKLKKIMHQGFLSEIVFINMFVDVK